MQSLFYPFRFKREHGASNAVKCVMRGPDNKTFKGQHGALNAVKCVISGPDNKTFKGLIALTKCFVSRSLFSLGVEYICQSSDTK